MRSFPDDCITSDADAELSRNCIVVGFALGVNPFKDVLFKESQGRVASNFKRVEKIQFFTHPFAILVVIAVTGYLKVRLGVECTVTS